MTSGFNVTLEASQVGALVASLGALPAQVNKAADMAAKDALNWALGRITRELAAALGINLQHARKRARVRRHGGPTPGWHLFLGINSMPYDRTDSVKQNAAGMGHKVGLVKSGWVNKMTSSHNMGWIRKGRARQLGMKLPHLGGGPSDNAALPIIRIHHDLEQPATPIFMQYEKQVQRHFMRRFEHHLKRLRGSK